MLDRRISFFWSGKRMSWMRYMTLYSFRRWNPDFPVRLYQPTMACCDKTWSGPEKDDGEYEGQDYMPMLASLGIEFRDWTPPVGGLSHSQASDLFQWDLLGSEGGFYADMDILWLRPLDALYDRYRWANALFCLEGGGAVCGIGFFGAGAKCPLFADVYAAALSGFTKDNYESAGVAAIYRLLDLESYACRGDSLLDRLRNKYAALRIKRAPDETVYPLDYSNYQQIFLSDQVVSANTFGIHWFGGGDVCQEWNRLLNGSNFRNYHNAFTRYARTVCG